MTTPPTQLGSYRIDREIGRGGMGVVYLGRDTKLDRAVAIKALPEELAQDADRLRRFQREARLLAQLTHANIAGVHGMEEQEGTQYLVMEYVEGESLAEVIERGPLAVDETLRICAQVAAGLEAAHESGVIHRDLKPGNIMVTPQGKVKVLDFGLAKKVELGGSSVHLVGPSTATTASGPTTEEGKILGTSAYMSPEQARGKKLDKRTDIWSFGCVLFECLTGQRVFGGETPADTRSAILSAQPPWHRLPPDTPAFVQHTLERCLAKDPNRRLHHISDARVELEEALTDTSAISTSVAGGAPAERTQARGLPVLAFALLTVVAITAGIAGWSFRSVTEPRIDAARRPHITMTQLTDDQGAELWPSISPDGSTIVYESIDGGDSDIFMQRVGGFNTTNLTPDSEGEDYAPAISADGQFIAFRSERDGGGIFIMGATGESPMRVSDFGFDPAWSPDGTHLALTTERVVNPYGRERISELWVVHVASGDTTRIYEGDAVQPNWSPSGMRIACWRYWQGGQRDLFTLASDGTNLVEVTNDPPTDWNPVWSPDGQWLYFSSDRGGSFAIWRIAIDESTGNTRGEPEQITTANSATTGNLSFSRDDHRLTFTYKTTHNSLQRLDLDSSTGEPIGSPRTLTPFTTNAAEPAISPDGRLVAYYNFGERQEDLFIISSDGTGRRRITNDPAKDRGPRWMNDGSHLVFFSDRNGRYRAWTIRTDGSGLEMLTEEEIDFNAPLFSPDGKFLVGVNEHRESQLVRLEQGEDRTPQPLPPHPDGLTRSIPRDWSSDSSKLLVVWLNEDLVHRILTVLDIETGIYKRIASVSSPVSARFYSDSRFVLMHNSPNIYKIDSETGETQTIYTQTRGVAAAGTNGIDIAPDESWICFTVSETEADIWMIEFGEP